MQKELTCEQVGAIITFYLEGRLSDYLKKAVKHHLENCPKCQEKFEELKKMIEHFAQKEHKSNIDNEVQNEFKQKQYKDFKHNLSAYVDNELDEEESIRIKKVTISNPIARKDLEEMYAFKKLLHTAFDKTKNDTKYDYSKQVLNQMLNQPQKEEQYFSKLILAYCIMFTIIIVGAATILHGS